MPRNLFKRSRTTGNVQSEGDEGAGGSSQTLTRGHLSSLPREAQEQAFRAKFKGFIVEKRVNLHQLAGYPVASSFKRLGWFGVLQLDVEGYYPDVACEWMSTLRRDGDTLTGRVNGNDYTITPSLIRETFRVDTLRDQNGELAPYMRLRDDQEGTLFPRCLSTVFSNVPTGNQSVYSRRDLSPIAKLLWRIVVWNVHPRHSDMAKVRTSEILILHALMNGEPLFSYALLVIDQIWDAFDRKEKATMPFGFLISELLKILGAVDPETDKFVATAVHTKYLDTTSFNELQFVRTNVAHVLTDTHIGKELKFRRRWGEHGEELSPERQPFVEPEQEQEQQQPDLQPADSFPSIPAFSPFSVGPSGGGPDLSGIELEMRNLRIQQEQYQQENNARMTSQEQMLQQLLGESRAAQVERRADRWALERQRYYYEREQENLRQFWNETLEPGSLPYPAVQHVSYLPPQPGSQYYTPDWADSEPPDFAQYHESLFGRRP